MKINNDSEIGQVIVMLFIAGCIIWFATLAVQEIYRQSHPQNKLINIEPLK